MLNNIKNFKHLRIIFLVSVLVLVIAYWFLVKSAVIADTALRQNLEWRKTDFSRHSVNLDEIQSGGPPRDGIPAIDNPSFISVDKANAWLNDKEPVIVLEIGEDVRAYPIQIMIYHEIVNDVVNHQPVAVTFCPLCNATLVFDRRVEDKVLDFGTTGKLRKSDLVMYDRQTESWWQQFNGTGIVGHYTGVKLKQLTASIVAYSDFKSAYPDGRVLSRKTGHFRPYGNNPYRGYDNINNIPFLLDEPADKRLPPMERVIFIGVGEQLRLYPFSIFKKQKIINDMINQEPVVVFSKKGTFSALDAGQIVNSREIPSATAWSRVLNGQVLNFHIDQDMIADKETGSSWDVLGRAVSGTLKGQQLNKVNSGVHFAFAWLAFNPDSDIYTLD